MQISYIRNSHGDPKRIESVVLLGPDGLRVICQVYEYKDDRYLHYDGNFLMLQKGGALTIPNFSWVPFRGL